MHESEALSVVTGEFRIDGEHPRPGIALLTIHGDADLYSARELREQITAAIDGRVSTLIVDLTDVSAVDSVALGTLLGGMKRARAFGCALRLVVPQAHIRRLFEITLLDRVFPLDDSLPDALLAAGAERRAD